MRLRPEKGRLLIPVGERCPLGCTYCYTAFEGFQHQPLDLETLLREVRELQGRHRIRTLQIGYDGDPLASWSRTQDLLEALLSLEMNLNIQTKGEPDGPQLDVLGALASRLEAGGRHLSVLVSMTSWESAPALEPLAPPPGRRLAGLAALTARGIPCFLALRPLVPGIPGQEITRILEGARDAGARGVIPGPLYIHGRWPDAARLLERSPSDPRWRTLQAAPTSPPWDPQGSRWLRIVSRRAMEAVQEESRRLGLPVLWSSARAMDLLEARP
ncbi:MAG: radical SAM protein [Deltaproteobacteria bacterium]|nr:radical SAM protein [Deltaproteobacteria bacterium]